MIDLCTDVNFPDYAACCGDRPNKPVDELPKRQIELYLQFNPEYEFDRIETEFKDGIWTATPIYRHKEVLRIDELKDKGDEFRSQNIV